MRRPCLFAAAMLVSGTTAHAGLEIRNIQAAYGPLGPERKVLNVYPSDEVVFRYLITGVKVDGEGRVVGELKLTLSAPDGRILLDETSPTSGVAALGGGSLPGTARVSLPADIPPGAYTLTVTFRDKQSSETASFRRTLDIKASEFAAVALRFSYDPEGKVPAPVGGLVGQMLHFRLKAIGFDRTTGRSDLEMVVRVLDAQGRPTMPVPIRATVDSDDADLVRRATEVNLNGNLTLNRAGDFTLSITVTDRVGKKTTKFEAPLHVASP
jgi:hypothetical protein